MQPGLHAPVPTAGASADGLKRNTGEALCWCLQGSVSVPRTTELHILNGRMAWHVNHPSTELLDYKEERGRGTRDQSVNQLFREHIQDSLLQSFLNRTGGCQVLSRGARGHFQS